MIFILVEWLRGRLMPYPFWIGDPGRRGEYLVRRRFHRQGYHLVAKNWRHGRGEIDLIMANYRELLFVEVKTRRQDSPTEIDLVRKDQRERLLKLGRIFVSRWGEVDLHERFLLARVNYTPGSRNYTIETGPLT